MIVFTILLFETQKNKYLISPDGEPLGIIPDAKKEKKTDTEEKIVHPQLSRSQKRQEYSSINGSYTGVGQSLLSLVWRRMGQYRYIYRLHRVSYHHFTGWFINKDRT